MKSNDSFTFVGYSVLMLIIVDLFVTDKYLFVDSADFSVTNNPKSSLPRVGDCLEESLRSVKALPSATEAVENVNLGL